MNKAKELEDSEREKIKSHFQYFSGLLQELDTPENNEAMKKMLNGPDEDLEFSKESTHDIVLIDDPFMEPDATPESVKEKIVTGYLKGSK